MSNEFVQYTFTFDRSEEKKFRQIKERLEPEDFKVVEDIHPVDENVKDSDLTTVIEMDPDSALTFRLGLKLLKIRRYRTPEEEAELAEQEAKNKVTIRVKVGTGGGTMTGM